MTSDARLAVDGRLRRHTDSNNHVTGVDLNTYLLREAAVLVRKEGLERAVEFQAGNAEALPFSDATFDMALSVTVLEEGDADRMLAELVRVTKPGGGVAVIVRACDRPFLMNVPLRESLKSKVEAPTGWAPAAAPKGCADASLYGRFHRAGLTAVKMFPQLATLDGSADIMLHFLEDLLLPTLLPDEVQEWRIARARAEADGVFFVAWPHHCAIGTRRAE